MTAKEQALIALERAITIALGATALDVQLIGKCLEIAHEQVLAIQEVKRVRRAKKEASVQS